VTAQPAGPGSPVVAVTIWGVPPVRVPAALARMALHRPRLRGVPGLRFAKLLGTGSGRSFTPRDADPLHWGLLTVWDDGASADAFAAGPVHRSWARICSERLDLRLAPLASRGRWAGQRPFEPVSTDRPDGGPVAAITRARLRPSRAASFWRAVAPVSAELAAAPGLRLAVGIGEAPIGLQGTLSVWASAADLERFAYRGPAHAAAIRQTGPQRWYAEELFARFAVTSLAGSYGGRGRPA
jgi:hypothetical protein